MLAVASVEGYFLWLNDAWTMLGWSLDELRARAFIEFVHPDDVEPTLTELTRLSEGHRTVRFVNRYQTKSGDWRWIEWNSHPVGDRIYASARDVTQLHEALATAQRQVETLELAEQIGNFGHWRIDVATNALHWSPNVYRIHGLDPESFRPTVENAIAAYHPDDRDGVQRYVESAIERRAGWDFRLRLQRSDGEERLVRAVGRVQLDPNAKDVTGLFGVFQDVTEREQALMQRHSELEQFAYAAAHDLQAPLRTMLGFLQLLEEELDESASEDVKEYLTRLTRSASRMRALVGELYRYAKVVGTDGRTESVDLGALLEGIVQEREADLKAADATVEVTDLPAVLGVPAPLTSVFANLVDNAIKYRSPDRQLRIQVRGAVDGAHAAIDVSDNGRGFSPEHAEKVFGLFTQLDGDKRDGMGVGLALCRKIIERHRGSISVTPRPDEGVTVHLRLPLAPPT